MDKNVVHKNMINSNKATTRTLKKNIYIFHMDVKILKMVLEFTKNQFPYKLNYLLNTDSFF